MPAPENYVDVAERLAAFRAAHPEGTLQPVNLDKPFDVLTIGDKTFIVYTAAAYRTPDDPRPGIGVAYEPFPGKTNFTRDSELQNAETSAWGRAIVAVGAADTKRNGIASAQDVRNRQADRDQPAPQGSDGNGNGNGQQNTAARARAAGVVNEIGKKLGMGVPDLKKDYAERHGGTRIQDATTGQLDAYATVLRDLADAAGIAL